jgi:hypothetical protein
MKPVEAPQEKRFESAPPSLSTAVASGTEPKNRQSARPAVPPLTWCGEWLAVKRWVNGFC